MFRLNWKSLLIGVVVVVAFSSMVQQADAQWWGYYRTVGWGCCYSPCYTPCYTTCYTPCYSPCYTVSCDPCCYDGGWYLGWRPGPIRRLLFGRYRWYWGGYAYPAYSCCYTPGCCTDAATPTDQPSPTPAQKPIIAEPPATPMPTEPAPAPGNDLPPLEPQTTSADTSGVLTVWVPYGAEVTINGLKTTSKGSRRQFISHGLKPGFSYKYVVKATLVRDGQLLEDTRTVALTAGEITAVAFGFNINQTEQMASVQ